ncbi:MAG: o-succinylbenzoate synthase [Bacteroidales bacterium]|nr:o-succinylbenzoate synthase [Bacteroidales bacterium]
MSLSARIKPYTLHFRFPAGTSRGVLHEKKGCFLVLERDGMTGIGECPLLPGLSIDPIKEYAGKLQEVCNFLNAGANASEIELIDFPSIAFGLETALLDLENLGTRKLFAGNFADGIEGIPINGLVWMGERDFMEQQIREKIASGYRCIKLKIGTLDFDTEMEILTNIRKSYPPQELEIRLDANGAFKSGAALERLKQLSEFTIHSIEQPIKANQWEQMALLCAHSPIPVALDEELIGIMRAEKQEDLLKTVNPAYIILKPSLLGGFSKSQEWINLALKFRVGWWVTSALESNIGLNAIAQWTSTLQTTLLQGLGTGQLFHDNIKSPLLIEAAKLWYKPELDWNLEPILNE